VPHNGEEIEMLSSVVDGLESGKVDSLAGTFRRLGRIGFWTQVLLGAFPVILMVYVFVFTGNLSVPGTRAGLRVIEHLTVLNLIVLVFTTIWFFRYRGLAKRIADPAARPSRDSLLRTVWTGLVASSLGAVFSMLLLLLEVGQLLFYFLSAPQGGMPAIQAAPAAGSIGSWVSAVDVASLMSLLLTLSAEVIALVFGLWLLFRTSRSAVDAAAPAEA
jgi:Protein of unknown function (DUF3611)